MTIKEGDPAPAFDLPTASGRRRVGDAAGRPYVIYFYPKDDTPGCTKEAIGFSESYPEFQKLGVEVIGVSKDSGDQPRQVQEEARACASRSARTRPARSSRRSVPGSRRACTGKKYMGIDRSTFLVGRRRPDRAKAWRGVKVPGHVEEVLEAARELAEGKAAVSPAHARPLDERLYDYYSPRSALREHPAHAGLRAATDALPDGGMRSSAEQGQLLALLVELTGVRRVLEIGCFTGYSTLAMALALPPDGRVVTLDVNERWSRGRPPLLARRPASRTGSSSRSGSRSSSLDRLLAGGGRGRFDLAYVDADKKALRCLLRAERSSWSGRAGSSRWTTCLATAPSPTRPTARRQTETIRALNAKLGADERVSLVMLPVGDGVTLLRKRAG